MPVAGEHGPPLVGHSFSFLGDMLGFGRRQRERFGPVSWVSAFATRMVVALGPDAIEEVLTNRDRAFSNRDGWDYVIGPFVSIKCSFGSPGRSLPHTNRQSSSPPDPSRATASRSTSKRSGQKAPEPDQRASGKASRSARSVDQKASSSHGMSAGANARTSTASGLVPGAPRARAAKTISTTRSSPRE